MNCRERIENHFGMSFDQLIQKLHWGENRSIHSLAKECGLSHTPFIRLAKLTNLRLRTHKEASSLNMRINNAVTFFGAAEKRAIKIKNTFVNNLLPQELVFKEILLKAGKVFEMQKPIGAYNVDFFVPDKNMCIEIDSSYKWGLDRKKAAFEKDKYLIEKGYRVIRLNKAWLNDLKNIIELICD